MGEEEKGEEQRLLGILSYNIAGLRNKTLFPGFFSYVRSFDIFCLYETHVLKENYNSYTKFFGGFEVCWVSAARASTYGRASGGLLLGIKTELFLTGKVRFVWKGDWPFVQLRQGSDVISFIPAYINCTSWESDFDNFSDLFTAGEITNIVILGDFNVRIGQLQNLPEELEVGPSMNILRKSQDVIVNGRGKRFLELCSDLGLAILNGRTEGDRDGKYTYVSGSGVSVNDIIAVSYNLCPLVSRLIVDEQMFSDHFPLHLSWILDNSRQCIKPLSLLPKLNWNAQNPDVYRTKLSDYCNTDIFTGSIESLVEIIRRSSVKSPCNKQVFKQKWFDNDCLRARNLSFKWLNLFRKTASGLARQNYVKYIKKFKELCRAKKDRYYNAIIGKLEVINDPKSWWGLAKEINGKKFITSAILDVEDFREYFKLLLNSAPVTHTILYAAPLIQDSILDRNFELSELREVLNKVKDNKAPGIDGIPYEFYKNAPEDFLSCLLKCYNEIFENGDVPGSFVKSVIFPIHKKGDANCVENYRGLSFMDAAAKLLAGMLYNRASLWEKRYNILHECQAGFRSGYSTVDNIFNLLNIIKLSHSLNTKKVYAFFVDFKSAFDTIDRNSLFYKLYKLGMSTKFVRILQSMYENTQSQIWNGDKLSESFLSNTGVRQGCILSPLLFALFINDIEGILESGLVIEDIEIKVLMYADDLVILSDDPVKLQRMIYQLEGYCQMWNLVVNLEKSKIMIFQRGGGRRRDTEHWSFGNEAIDVVKEYAYLGIILTPKLSMATNFKNRLDSAKISINIIWNNFFRNIKTRYTDKLKLFDAVSRSILCYGAQIWGFQQYELVEKLQRFFIKKLFKLPQQTPNYMIALETGLPCIYTFTLKLHFEYLARVLYKYDNNRLPYRLAAKTMEKNIYWYTTWQDLAVKHDIDLNTGQLNNHSFKVMIAHLMRKEDAWLRSRAVHQARSTIRHELYDRLHYFSEQSYVKDCFSVEKINLIWRYRGGLVYLNSSPWRREGSSLCSLCNLNEEENLLHFFGRCPILTEFRVLAFGKRVLKEAEVIDILNGKNNYNDLFLFATKAWRYRKFLVNEFND